MLGAFAGEGLSLPSAPAFAEPHSGDSGHQVELGWPYVAIRRGEDLELAVDGPVVMGEQDLRGYITEALDLLVLRGQVHDRVEHQVGEAERPVDLGGGEIADRQPDRVRAGLGS